MNLGKHIGKIVDSGNYFPYGKVLREYSEGSIERYLTTFHERDEETGLDYRGARYYDSDIARFLSTDPWQQKYPSWSTYNYVMGNPVMLIDPNGKGATDWVQTPLETIYDSRVHNQSDAKRLYGHLAVYRSPNYHYESTEGTVKLLDGGKYRINGVWGKSRDRALDYTPTESGENEQLASFVEAQVGKPYVWGKEGPKSFDCSGVLIAGIRQVNPNFPRLNADGIFNKYTLPATEYTRGNLLFYDYTDDGDMDHVTTILNSNTMLHPSSGQGKMEIRPLTYLDYTKDDGGKIYLRQLNWQLINLIK